MPLENKTFLNIVHTTEVRNLLQYNFAVFHNNTTEVQKSKLSTGLSTGLEAASNSWDYMQSL